MELSMQEKTRRLRIHTENLIGWLGGLPHEKLPELDDHDGMLEFLDRHHDSWRFMMDFYTAPEYDSEYKGCAFLWRKTGFHTHDCFVDFMKDLEKFCGVYFLFCGKELVYIGKSKHLGKRLVQSIAERTSSECFIDSFAFCPAPTASNRAVLERVLIAEYQPELNTEHRNDDSFSMFYSQIDPYALERFPIFKDLQPIERAA